MATRYLSDAPLHVAPELVGAPLASPMRRFLAYALDWTLLLVPTLAVTVIAVAAWLRVSDRPAFDALRSLPRLQADPALKARSEREMARLLVQIDAPGLPPAMAVAVEEHRLDDAAAILSDHTLRITPREEPTPRPPGHIVLPLERLIPGAVRGMVLFAVPAVYFTVLTRLFGATVGKALLGIRVRSLDGERIPMLEAFERFIGYLHIPALLFFPVLYLWKDPNRQQLHDRVARTVVLRAPPSPPKKAKRTVQPRAAERKKPAPEPEPPEPPAA